MNMQRSGTVARRKMARETDRQIRVNVSVAQSRNTPWLGAIAAYPSAPSISQTTRTYVVAS